ncbi:MAG: hypothetical protein AAFY22_14395 [Pseudomonadota bacterium]
MLDMIWTDVSGILRGTFLQGDLISLLIAFGSVAIAALVMRSGRQIGSMTLLALVLFVIGGYLRGVFAGSAGEAAAVSNRFGAQLEASWGQFMDMQAGTLLAYFIAFMILIFLMFALKSIVARG